ncbi:S-layer homology domain-containing protein [Paenibacillus eucommiae]|uniref:SLH domain-containing protein n=1 Tax=Paenibacillus eucommiae TaxID=1355755 RepID=A0ABS4IYX4_9BACL|nr:S-layer homology domain-containing protein [Paenibacillus eucommiae]MBP1991739.1 hypothetical protein [Paenibacillus eucommiae]
MIRTSRSTSKWAIVFLVMLLLLVSFPFADVRAEGEETSFSANEGVPNMIANPGFEDDFAGWDVSWPDTVAQITDEAQSGSKAIKVNASSQEQTVPVVSGKSYKMTFWAKRAGPEVLNLVGINFWNVPGIGLQGARVTVDSSEYKQYEIYFTAPAGFSHSTIVIYRDPGIGWVYVDDMTLHELPNLAANPGFEDDFTGWDLSWPDTVESITSDAASGSKALKVNASSREQTVNIVTGQSYKMSFRAKKAGPPELNLVGINFWDVPGIGLQGSRVTVESADYKEYTVYFTAPPGFSKATIVVYKDAGTGSVYVDDFVLTEWSAQSEEPAPKRNDRTILQEQSKTQPYLMLMQQPDGNTTTPEKVKGNIEYIESLPFDGMMITPSFSPKLMTREQISYETIYDELKVLKGLFKRMDKNYLAFVSNRPADPNDPTGTGDTVDNEGWTNVGKSGDLFDDEGWSIVEQNVRNFARAAKEVGITRILYDNEEYFRKFSSYPQDSYYKEKSLKEYQDKASERGRQIMNAIVSEIPDATVMVLHGPYVSDKNKPDWFKKNIGTVNLMGPYFIGMLQAVKEAGDKAKLVDGGELYLLRSEGDFEDAYQFRKYELADSYSNNDFIPEELREDFGDSVSMAFGIYNMPWQNYPMTPQIMRTMLENALRSAEEMVWYYTEPPGGHWLIPGSMGQEWFDAVIGARQAVADVKTGTNRIYNGGFEFDDVNWDLSGSTEIMHNIGPILTAFSDANALVIGKEQGAAKQKLTTGLKQGSTYMLSAWGKALAKGDRAQVGIILKDELGNVVGEQSFQLEAEVYSKGSVSFVVPSGISSAEVYAKREAGDDYIFIDDIILREVEASSNADLSGLTLSGGALSPAFASGTTDYTSSVANDVTSLTVTGSVSQSHATMTVNGIRAESGQASGAINLNVGNNLITIVVTAQNGTTKTYEIAVTRAGASSSSGGSYTGSISSSDNIVTAIDGKLTLPAGKKGKVSLEDTITIDIPADAADKELKITIDKVAADIQNLLTNQDVLASPVFEILKNFSDNFKKPVTLTFTFDPNKVKSNQRAAVYYYDEAKKVWVEVAGGKVNGSTISVEVNHFTKFAVFVVDEASVIDPEPNSTFTDITGHWAEANIKLAVSSGIVSGYPDGTFKPGNNVTRAEFVVMLMNALKPQGEGAELAFTDTAKIGAWAQQAVAQAVQAGIIQGYEDGSFRPDAGITRAEMAVILANALGQQGESYAAAGFADDKNIPAWAKDGIAFVKQAGIVQGKGDNVFAPQDQATRAEAATILLNMLTYKSK